MIRDAIVLAAELVALFLGVSFLIGVGRRRLGNERLQQWMGGPPLVAALKGITIGFVTPFCTYSAIPLLVGFRQAGVRPAGYTAFIVAAPVLDPILFGALVLIVGWEAALLYLAVAFAAALGLAFAAEAVAIDRYLKPLPASMVPAGVSGGPAVGDEPACSSEGTASCDGLDEQPWAGWRLESRQAWRASRQLLRTMAPLLAVGIGIGLAITAVIPPDAASSVMEGRGGLAIPFAAALGTPLYFSTELFVPIADSLTVAGVSTGAVVALTISGAGANVPEFVILGKLFQRRLLIVFVSYVFAVAMIGGYLAAAIVG